MGRNDPAGEVANAGKQAAVRCGSGATACTAADDTWQSALQGLSLRVRLNVMIGLTMLLIVGLGFLFAIYSARQSVAQEVNSTVNLAMQLIEAGFAEHRDADRPIAGWLSQLNHLDRTRHLRIRVEPSSGKPAHKTAAQRVSSIEAPGWFVWAVAPERVTADKRVTIDGQRDVGIRVEAEAGDEIDEAWHETQGFLWLIAALAAAIYAVVHVTVGRALRSIGLILEGLEEIDRGDYGMRLPHFPLPEFARISQAFNHMAASLAHTRNENRALAQQSMAIQEEERRHLAQELHDELGQSLTAIKVLAASLRHAGNSAQEPVAQIMTLCDRLFGVVRSMMRRLRPLVLDELGLTASLEDLIEHWRARHPGIHWVLLCEDGLDARSGTVRIHLFRIVQECLTNIVRHSKARRVHIELNLIECGTSPGWLIHLVIRDDGQGFDPGQPRRGLGLRGMQERVMSLGGRFDLHTAPGRGVAIEAMVPCGTPDR